MSQRTAHPSASSASTSSRVANGGERKRSAKGATTDEMAGTMPERKKARTDKRKQQQPSFKPRPIREQAEEPPDEPMDLPPPPSTRKIARLRESMGAERARIETPAPARKGKVLQYGSGSDSEDDGDGTRAQSLFTPKAPNAVPHLLFKPIGRPRPSAAPPPSPGLPSGPPPTLPRRARKSRLGEAIFDSVMPLPITDTPVINKNRELRKDAERRSSLGMRGQRASSSFGRGDPSYPHSGISHESFYKHIPIDQPEPIKARWLISWCAKRALDEQLASAKRKKQTEQSAEIDKILSEVVDDFVAKVAKGNVDTNVFGAPTAAPTASTTISVKPHPRNVENRATMEKEEAIIKRMRAEDRDWNRIAAKTNDLQALTLEATSSRRDACPPPDMKEAADYFQRMLKLSDDAIASSSRDIGAAGDFGEVEFEVDMLHQTSHQASQYMHQTQRFLDGIFSSLAADLRARDGQSDTLPPLDDTDSPDTAALLASAAAGPSRPRHDPMNMLRALAAADSKQQNAEIVAKAAAVSVAPSTSTRTQAVTPRRAAAAATPRRQSVYGRGTGTPGRRQ